MRKKLIIIASVLFIVILCISLYFILSGIKKNNHKDIFDENIKYVITLDINPSIEISLNKDNKVVNIKALNKDAKSIINTDLKEKDLDDSLNILVNNLKKENYLENAKIIVYSDNFDTNIVKGYLENSLKDEKYEIIIPKVTENSKKIASENNITIGKAAYLESIINENDNINISDIIDISLNEIDSKINDIKNSKENNIKEEENINNNNSSSNNNNNNNSNNNNNIKPSSNRPTNAQDKSGVWCTYNANKPYYDTFNYPEMISANDAMNIGKNYVQSIDARTINYSECPPIDDIRGSYCKLYKYSANNGANKYYIYIDSVTGAIIDKITEVLEAPKITNQQAIDIGLSYFNLDADSCKIVEAYYSENLGVMRYTFNAQCNEVYYTAHINSTTGELSNPRSWQ